ncbi:copper amine oxidase N-terminal domain-containing protein [Paenibacillus sp. DCT19]|uniref:copper amine oxidase N-terminal domain-containing protein n=1 Tax=Paenibacillus sp. DCT19 TaxID=2211212 RepID=UPI000FE197C8|nr:copper amine oxidase N-terminal domain-containing protein [Paenibacillus sp. DCT19]
MNKLVSVFIIFLFIHTIGLSAAVSASELKESPIIVDNGKIISGRTLIPIKVVSTHFGYQVGWEQEAKVVTILGRDTTIRMKINSNEVSLNDQKLTLEVPAQIYNGVTYVPLKFLSDVFGASIRWNSTFKVAQVLWEDQTMLIYTEIKRIPDLTDKQVDSLSKAANEAAVITDMKYAKEHFKPYFTDKLLGKILWNKGLPFRIQFDSKHQSAVTYLNIYHSEAVMTHLSYFALHTWVTRMMELEYVDHHWKISRIDFKYTYF